MGSGITKLIGGPHDFLPPRSDRSDEFQKLWSIERYERICQHCSLYMVED